MGDMELKKVGDTKINTAEGRELRARKISCK